MRYSSKMNHFKGIINTYNHVNDTLHAGTTTQVVEASICHQQSYFRTTLTQTIIIPPTYNTIKD